MVQLGWIGSIGCFNWVCFGLIHTYLGIHGSQEQSQGTRFFIGTLPGPHSPIYSPRGNCAQSSPPHVINKYNIVFVEDVQRERYDALVTRKISAPKYIDVELLQGLGMWDDMNASIGHLGYCDYVQLQFPVYEKTVWEFFSSFTIDTKGEYRNRCCYIVFRLGDLTHEMNLTQFSKLLQLSSSGTADFIRTDYGESEFW